MNITQMMSEATSLAQEESEALTRLLTAPTSEPVAQKVIAFYRRMDARMGEATEPIACAAGCSYCCYYHVLVTGAEAITLAEHVDRLPEPRRTEVRKAIEQTATRVSAMAREEYLRTNVPCAFLNGGRCSVYSVRPTACRGFHSRDASVCEEAFDNPLSDPPNQYDPAREAVKIGFKNAVLAAQFRAGADATSYEMHGAVAEALKNGSSTKRWRSGKLSFPTVKDRTSIEEMTQQ
ncbi:YkgJ family cysteine cluster protein [Paraburkholderia sp. BR10872]|uniref:YkgJ family cysteine cluster protein n=1 Tax=Paraburkholderia sp. BR10872 TaxID=3236989 RepID=UPI0034D2A15B